MATIAFIFTMAELGQDWAWWWGSRVAAAWRWLTGRSVMGLTLFLMFLDTARAISGTNTSVLGNTFSIGWTLFAASWLWRRRHADPSGGTPSDVIDMGAKVVLFWATGLLWAELVLQVMLAGLVIAHPTPQGIVWAVFAVLHDAWIGCFVVLVQGERPGGGVRQLVTRRLRTRRPSLVA